MMLDFETEPKVGPHQSRCCSATIVQICSGTATASARNRASRSSEYPPRREQNCFGTAMPDAFVVKRWRRRPSPPANTITQVVPETLIVRHSLSLILCATDRVKHAPNPSYPVHDVGRCLKTQPDNVMGV